MGKDLLSGHAQNHVTTDALVEMGGHSHIREQVHYLTGIDSATAEWISASCRNMNPPSHRLLAMLARDILLGAEFSTHVPHVVPSLLRLRPPNSCCLPACRPTMTDIN